MRHKPRIGFHCPGTGSGGPWRYVHSLLKSIDLDHFEVCVICDIAGGYEPRPEIRVVHLASNTVGHTHPGTTADRTPPITNPRRSRIPQPARVVAGFLKNARHLARIIAPLKLDLFHTQNTGCEEAPVAARLAGVPHVVGTFHTDWTYDLNLERDGFEYRFLEKLSNNSLHKAIAVSAATGRNWRRRTLLATHRVVTIHNGIDASAFGRRQSRESARWKLDLPADAFIVAGLGRLDAAKGFGDLIDTAAMLKSAMPNLIVAFAGDGPLKAPLESLADGKGLSGIVKFLGFQTDVQPVLDAADLFALPSLCEACPYAVLEAMATGLPVLGSDVGGVSELIDSHSGLVLPPRSPAQWAVAIQSLATDFERRTRLGNAGRERVELHFQECDMVQKTFAVYDEVLARMSR